MTTHKKQRFAPFPLPALRDHHLGALHLRTLGMVAAFDRLGKNGSGCWASQHTIAEIVGVDKARLSHSLSALRDYGCVTSEMNPDKRWFRVHRVICTDADSNCLATGKSVASQDNSLSLMCSNRQHQVEYSRADCNGDEAGKRAAYNGGPNYRMVSFSAACTHRAISSEAHQSVVFRHGLPPNQWS